MAGQASKVPENGGNGPRRSALGVARSLGATRTDMGNSKVVELRIGSPTTHDPDGSA